MIQNLSSTVPCRSGCNCPMVRRDLKTGFFTCDSPEVCSRLELLDDAMFAAIGGDPAALVEAGQLWNDAQASLSPDLLEESREQYLRYAVEVTQRLGCDQVREPAHALAAVQILQLLTKV